MQRVIETYAIRLRVPQSFVYHMAPSCMTDYVTFVFTFFPCAELGVFAPLSKRLKLYRCSFLPLTLVKKFFLSLSLSLSPQTKTSLGKFFYVCFQFLQTDTHTHTHSLCNSLQRTDEKKNYSSDNRVGRE